MEGIEKGSLKKAITEIRQGYRQKIGVIQIDFDTADGEVITNWQIDRNGWKEYHSRSIVYVTMVALDGERWGSRTGETFRVDKITAELLEREIDIAIEDRKEFLRRII
jgi:hypothetical protein